MLRYLFVLQNGSKFSECYPFQSLSSLYCLLYCFAFLMLQFVNFSIRFSLQLFVVVLGSVQVLFYVCSDTPIIFFRSSLLSQMIQSFAIDILSPLYMCVILEYFTMSASIRKEFWLSLTKGDSLEPYNCACGIDILSQNRFL